MYGNEAAHLGGFEEEICNSHSARMFQSGQSEPIFAQLSERDKLTDQYFFVRLTL